ncbi:hypothetical protein TWF569_002566 [Orbilia oligospora]|uniref:Methyltransferase type 11 domain-containing protein n=1 Tax=Orbilia oligospora TaxID=2813651 RepID=A0A7C8JWZ9_ORBOL|nr:hypothetical protein TWF102_004379 [Orbilia oligospora]KAF3110438.1 hypothetical protein TWF103_004709 [Orbilia oligospora]KAF3121518.1 hypothetical protein TWF569_002566 [Orbilia oligospora]KAF3130194.1 hypothetical protein TWF703_008361 [Orbilia oligospora]
MFGTIGLEYGDPRDRETVGQRKNRKVTEREGSVLTNNSSERSSSPAPSSGRKPSSTASSSAGSQKQAAPSIVSQKPKSRFGFFGSKSKDAPPEKKSSVSMSEGENSTPEPKISLLALDTTSLQPPKPINNGRIYNQHTPPTSEYDISRQPPMPPPSVPVPPTPDTLEGPTAHRTRQFPTTNQRIASDFNLRPILTSSSDDISPSSPNSGRIASIGSGSDSHQSQIETIDHSLQSFYIAEHETNYKFRPGTRDRMHPKPQPIQTQIQTQTLHQHQWAISHMSNSGNTPTTAGLPSYDTLGYSHHLPIDSKPPPSMRSASRSMSEKAPPSAHGRSSFHAALQKMENAGLKIMFKRLSEDWGNSAQDSDNTMLQEIAFEQRLWALVAAEWLTFGKSLQSDAHEYLLDAHITDGRRLLHLHGSAADGWVLAAKYPNVTVYSVSSQDISNPPCQWSAPLNHHALFLPQPNSPLPFPDNYFDVISTKSFPSILRLSEWVPILRECNRVLRPGGWIELQIVDPVLTKQGELLREWLEARIVREMLEDSYAIKPSDDVLGFLQETGFDNVKRSRIALPASFNPKLKNIARGQGPDPDAARVMVLVGRHFYEELYRGFNPIMNGSGGDQLWWQNKAIKHECEVLNTCFGLTFAFAQKI